MRCRPGRGHCGDARDSEPAVRSPVVRPGDVRGAARRHPRHRTACELRARRAGGRRRSGGDFAITDVFKPNSHNEFAIGDSIVVTRAGGELRRKGQILNAVDESRLALDVGSTYLLFLKYLPETQDYWSDDPLGAFLVQYSRPSAMTKVYLPTPMDTLSTREFIDAVRVLATTSIRFSAHSANAGKPSPARTFRFGLATPQARRDLSYLSMNVSSNRSGETDRRKSRSDNAPDTTLEGRKSRGGHAAVGGGKGTTRGARSARRNSSGK
jgi:hypothetical protein